MHGTRENDRGVIKFVRVTGIDRAGRDMVEHFTNKDVPADPLGHQKLPAVIANCVTLTVCPEVMLVLFSTRSLIPPCTIQTVPVLLKMRQDSAVPLPVATPD